jgi:putative phosphoesterase
VSLVAILSDTHGVLDPRIAELVRRCRHVVHAGDIGGAAVLAQLQPGGGRVLAVIGNNDVPTKWPAEDVRVLAGLPQRAELALPGGILALEHGHTALPVRDRHAILRRRHPGARAVVYGHSHRLSIDREATPWVLNPGAAGRARTYGGPSCLLLDASNRNWTLEVRRFPPS